ncbi:hypothetical protein NL64_10880 [Pseudomonas fluorescens]|uniref:hypothetical protein n=1 Tax=Pseudomonas fluorescens TaxID=294 RepID=UPI00054B5D0D|nr:hypothetical protein [Pseudomonas fluorescens]KII32617.1 hypothetical protein NL64_10880 [Pseudomonas fluorescens]
MLEFLINNWLSIVSILIGLLVAYVSYRVQKKDSVSASVERKKHAHSELLDVIESYLINKQQLSESVIENLIYAAERAHFVALRPECTTISLLQDVALRLQRSRHLDIPQKSEYSVAIDSLIRDVRASSQPLTWEKMKDESSGIITEVVGLVPEDRRMDVEDKLLTLGAIGTLAKSFGEVTMIEDRSTRLTWFTAAVSGVAATLAASSVGTKLLMGGEGLSGFFANRIVILSILGMLMIALVATVFAWRNMEKQSNRA